jgi:hypothetical protein
MSLSPASPPDEDLTLGESERIIECLSAEDNQRVAVALIAQTERSLDIFSQDLEPWVYDSEACAEAMLNLILRNRRYSRIRLLIQDPLKVARRGHRILELGMRLSSHIQMRKPGEDSRDLSYSFLLADRVGLLYRENAEYARANFCDRAWAGQLARDFDRMWENAEPDENLRRLML